MIPLQTLNNTQTRSDKHVKFIKSEINLELKLILLTSFSFHIKLHTLYSSQVEELEPIGNQMLSTFVVITKNPNISVLKQPRFTSCSQSCTHSNHSMIHASRAATISSITGLPLCQRMGLLHSTYLSLNVRPGSNTVLITSSHYFNQSKLSDHT